MVLRGPTSPGASRNMPGSPTSSKATMSVQEGTTVLSPEQKKHLHLNKFAIK